MTIKTKTINLSNTNERQQYSQKLQNFEKNFTYPLNDDVFYIKHGDETDYFTFFEKLGKPKIMILEDNQEIIGLCVAVLREINNIKYWYLCDFKITKEYRGKKLYRLLMLNYFLPFYFLCQNGFAINMSNPTNNKLFKHMSKIFKFLKIKINPNYLYSFNGEHLNNDVFNPSFWENHFIVSNNGEKDIVIQGQNQKLFHIITSSHFNKNLNKFTKIPATKIQKNDSIMLLSSEKINLAFASESIISLFLKGKNNINISSAEI